MKISFNPSNSNKNILDLIKSNKDIIFDLKGHNIFARGVEFKGTDTNTWRPVVDNLTSDSTTSSLSAKQGKVLKALIDGKSDSEHNHDGRYVRYYTVTTLDCNNLASGLTVAKVNATNAASAHHSAYLYISDVGTPFQIQIPDSDTSFIYKRYYSSGKWSGWFKLNAGYADSAGSVAWANVTNKPATATRWPSWAEVTGKPSSFTPADHNHDNKYLRWLGNAGQSNMNAIGRISHSSGMTALSDPGNTIDNPMEGSAKSTSWHLYWQTNYTDTPSGSNAWVAQIVNRAGTDRWWVRSRNGGTITNGTGWTSNWRFLVTAPTSGLGNGNQPIYINSAGEVVAANSYPTSLKSPHALTLKANGTTLAVYDGSSVKEANFTYANVGAASASHNHDERYVKSFGTSKDNIDSDWGQSFKTFDPIPSGTPPEKNPNISLLSIGNSFNRRKQLAFTYSNDNIYYRRRAGEGFTNWRRIAFANEIPSSLKNPHALTISLNGTSQGPYDGSVAKNINITPGSIGAATSGHNHDGRYVYNYGGIQMDGASVNKNALGMSTTSGITGDWWHILQAAWNGEYRWNSQIAFPTQNRNGMYYRSGLDDNTKWGSWIKLLDIGNSYVKDGKGIINGTTITQVDNSDKLDGYHASYSSSTPWGTIPVITTQGFMDIGKHLEFHHDNTTGSDYSTILMCTGNYSNIVDLPSESGTLALLSQVVSTSNFNWTNLPGKVVLGNEFNIVNAGYNNQLWFNYLPIDNRNSSAAISQYNMCNGNKGLASVYAYRFKADGKSCMWKDARNYAPFYATFNGGFEPILDIKTVSGDWSIGSYDPAGNYLIFSFTSDSDFNAGVNGTAWYYITTDGTFSGASRYINHTPGDPQSYMYSTSTGTYGGAIQIREVNEVLNNQSAWGYAPRITFHWGQRYAKGFGMRSDGQFAVDDVPIALTSNVLTFNNNANYLGANFNNPDFSKKAASTYIECWDGAGGWWNWMAGKFMKAGSSDAYVLLGGGGHKPLSEFSLNSSDYDNRYLKLTGGTMTGVIRFNNLINSASALVLDYKYSAGGFARDIVSMKNSVYGDADLGALSILCYPNSTSNGFQYIYLGTDKYDGTNNLRIYKDKVTFGNNILIDAGNIGSQRVAYATSAGSVSNSLNIFGVSYNGSAAKTVTTSTFVSQLSEGTSTVTDGTMFITSWASDSGFADTNAVNVPYKRKASCLWSYIDSKVSSKYLPLAGGTMNGNARIGHGSGNLYIGNSGNDGWVYTQDIASQKGTDKWWIRESGAAHFGNVYICAKSDYTTYDSSIIECYNDALYLNYYSSTKVILCKGGGSVGIGTVPSYKLDVKGQAQAQGFRHSNHNSDDAVLLAGGGYSQGVPVKYWSIETIIIYGPTQVSRTNRGGNYTFVTKVEPRINGSCTLTLQFPSGYNNYNTIIWAMGRLNQEAHDSSNSSIYATIVHLEGSKYYLNLADDESLNNGTCQLYFMCF